MKHTHSRKKMLLSSVAMLLVALIALGSATFAWYINQQTVTADNAKFAAAKAQGLEIKHKADGPWTTAITFDEGTNLSPASTDFNSSSASLIGGTGGEGTSYSNGTLKTGTNLTLQADLAAIKAATGSFYYDDAYVASSGAAVDAYTKINVNGSDDTYLIFLVYVDGALVGAYSSDSKTGAPTKATKIKNESGDAVADGTADVEGPGEYRNVGIKFTAKTKESGGTHVEVIGFADGFNTKCTSEKANATVCDIDLTFSTNKFPTT